jgi:elongation factor P
MASTSDIRNGFCMEFNHDIYVVIEFLHVKPGKGPAFVRTTLKSVTNGKVVDQTFPSGHKIEEVRVERRYFQYLYTDEMGVNLMNTETYDQISINPKLIGDSTRFLKEGMQVEVLYHSEKDLPLTVELPQHMNYTIIQTDEMATAGNTSTNAQKPATLDCGAEVKVPLFMNIGDIIRVDTRTGAYLERVKK